MRIALVSDFPSAAPWPCLNAGFQREAQRRTVRGAMIEESGVSYGSHDYHLTGLSTMNKYSGLIARKENEDDDDRTVWD